MKLKVTTNADALAAFSGSSYIANSGVYDVTIKFASLDVTEKGAESVNFNVDYNGNDQAIYGPFITSKAGDTIEVGAKLINSLAVIAGMTDDDEYVLEEEEHIVGKDKKAQVFNVITNFTDLSVKIQLQEEYSVNPKTNEIRKQLRPKNFFREDGASAAEVVSGKDIGKQLAIIEEKYANRITYNDGLTPEAVAAWKESKKTNAPTTPRAKAKPAAKQNSIFNK